MSVCVKREVCSCVSEWVRHTHTHTHTLTCTQVELGAQDDRPDVSTRVFSRTLET